MIKIIKLSIIINKTTNINMTKTKLQSMRRKFNCWVRIKNGWRRKDWIMKEKIKISKRKSIFPYGNK